MTEKIEFIVPNRVALGALGEVGSRLFLLQLEYPDKLVTIKLEKGHLYFFAALLEKLGPIDQEGYDEELLSLIDETAEIDYYVGLAEAELRRIEKSVVVKFTQSLEEVSDPEELKFSLKIALSNAQIQKVALCAEILIHQGRPLCPLCNDPIEQSGHSCPRQNGHGNLHL